MAGDDQLLVKIAVFGMVMSVMCTALIGVLFISVFHTGLIGAWIAMVLDQLLRTYLVIHRYNSGAWKKIRVAIR